MLLEKPGPQNTKHCGSIAATATMRALPSTACEALTELLKRTLGSSESIEAQQKAI